MNRLACLTLVAAMGVCFMAAIPRAEAQIVAGFGAAPECPYGYYDYAPYSCAPYGYYGPEWFEGDVFIGAGPWFHGRREFNGHVDNRFDRRNGFHGPFPNRGDRRDPARPVGRAANFHGNEMRDGRGHVGGGGGDSGRH